MSEKKVLKTRVDEETVKKIVERIEQTQFGSVTIVVHEGKVVQLETNAKIRLV